MFDKFPNFRLTNSAEQTLVLNAQQMLYNNVKTFNPVFSPVPELSLPLALVLSNFEFNPYIKRPEERVHRPGYNTMHAPSIREENFRLLV